VGSAAIADSVGFAELPLRCSGTLKAGAENMVVSMLGRIGTHRPDNREWAWVRTVPDTPR
jgi:hypothetical protein